MGAISTPTNQFDFFYSFLFLFIPLKNYEVRKKSKPDLFRSPFHSGQSINREYILPIIFINPAHNFQKRLEKRFITYYPFFPKKKIKTKKCFFHILFSFFKKKIRHLFCQRYIRAINNGKKTTVKKTTLQHFHKS